MNFKIIVEIILGFIVAILCVALLVSVTVLLYFTLDKRRNKKGKKDAAFIVLAIVFAIALLFRFIAAITLVSDTFDEQNSFVKAISQGVMSFYTTAGAFTLEGQEGEFFENVRGFEILRSIYFGSLLWMAASFFIIISLRVSYSFTSRLKLFKDKVLRLFTKGNDYYIFVNANEDTFRLAESIEKHHKNNTRSCFIIFASDELAEFDRNNELHQRIRMNGYCYRVLYKPKDKKDEKELMHELGLTNRPNLFKKVADNNVKIFAFNNNDDDKGNESRNSDAVLDDIDRFLLEILKKNVKTNGRKALLTDKQRAALDCDVSPYIDYYVLSNNAMNYEFYEKAITEKIEKYFDVEKFDENDYKRIKEMFQIHIVNEACMAGEDLVMRRLQKENDYLTKVKVNDNEEYRINYTNGNKARVLVIGFGQTGQRALDNLYETFSAIYPVYFDKNGKEIVRPTEKDKERIDKTYYKAAGFEAVVCDSNMKDIAKSYILSHPSYLFRVAINPDDGDGDNDKIINKDKLKIRYESHYKDKFDIIKEYLKFPEIVLLEKNHNDPEFENDVNGALGLQNSVYLFANFDAVVISLGDDEENISLANSLLGELRHQLYRGGRTQLGIKHRIFVNIRDERNVKRLNWNDVVESADNYNVFVYPFGDRKTLYSYDRVINEGPYRYVNALYSAVRKDGYTVNKIKNSDEDVRPINNNEFPPVKIIKNYLSVHPVVKESNEHSSRFANYVYSYIQKTKGNTDWDYLGNLEHIRWCRFHIASGYVYSSTFFEELTDKEEHTTKGTEYDDFYKKGYLRFKDVISYGKQIIKIHNCIIPYGFPGNDMIVPEKNRKNDYFLTKYAKFTASIREGKGDE